MGVTTTTTTEGGAAAAGAPHCNVHCPAFHRLDDAGASCSPKLGMMFLFMGGVGAIIGGALWAAYRQKRGLGGGYGAGNQKLNSDSKVILGYGTI